MSSDEKTSRRCFCNHFWPDADNATVLKMIMEGRIRAMGLCCQSPLRLRDFLKHDSPAHILQQLVLLQDCGAGGSYNRIFYRYHGANCVHQDDDPKLFPLALTVKEGQTFAFGSLTFVARKRSEYVIEFEWVDSQVAVAASASATATASAPPAPLSSLDSRKP